jgi:hypothetical protein
MSPIIQAIRNLNPLKSHKNSPTKACENVRAKFIWLAEEAANLRPIYTKIAI